MTNRSVTNRRDFLRGAGGVVVGLPLLASLRADAETTPPKRFIFMYHPNGVDSPTWDLTHGNSDTSFALAASHDPLQTLRDHVMWLSGFNLTVAYDGDGDQHQRGIGGLLTGQKLRQGTFPGNSGTTAGFAKGMSLDQALVPLLAAGSIIPSLQLGVHSAARDVNGAVSYLGDNQPLLPENDPRAVYRRLFLAGPTRDAAAEFNLARRSVLDAVLEQTRILRKRVSREDSLRLESHFTGVRELERRLELLPDQTLPAVCEAADEPIVPDPELVASMPEISALQIELAALALRCDFTRVITLSYSDARNYIAQPFINVPQDVHELTHLGEGAPERAGLARRDHWQCEQFSTLLRKLIQSDEANGTTLIDHSLLLWGSELSKGFIHSHENLPFVAAGHALSWRMNRDVQAGGRDHHDLLRHILQGFGGKPAEFGDPAYGTAAALEL